MDVTNLMIKRFNIRELGYDFMGYSLQTGTVLTFHHLIIPNRFIDYKNIDSKFIVKNSEFFILYKRYLKLRRSWNKRKVKIKNLF